MKTVIAIIVLVVIIALLLWAVFSLLKKNNQLKKENKTLQQQRAEHVKYEKENHDAIQKMHTGNDDADASASVDILHQLSQKRR